MSQSEGFSGRSLARRLILAALNHEDRGHSAVPTPRHPTMADLEAGTNFDPESAESRAKRLTVTKTDANVLIPPTDKLLVFVRLLALTARLHLVYPTIVLEPLLMWAFTLVSCRLKRRLQNTTASTLP